MRNETQNAAGILRDDLGFLSRDIHDLQGVRLAFCAQDEKCERVIVNPKVITNRLDVFQDQRWLPSIERKLP